MQQPIRAIYIGLTSYNSCLKLQNMLVDCHKLRSSTLKTRNVELYPHPNTILLLQHNPVYTIGIRQKDPVNDYSDLAAERLRNLGADFVRTNRGGLITFHGPGQLVAYPILNLRGPGLQSSIRCYVEALEQAIISTCATFGVTAARTADVGVWVGKEKIAAIGVHTSNGVTSHGLALNCRTDLSWFSHIVPCGLLDRGVTSLSHQLNREVSVEETLEPFTAAIAESLGCEVQLENMVTHSDHLEDQIRSLVTS